MRKPILALILALISFQVAQSQSASIRGIVTDTVEKKLLFNGAVVLLRKTDSVMVCFRRSAANGEFVLPNLPAGKFLLMVSFPAYADYLDEIELKDSASSLDLGRVMMTLKSQLLQAVVVSGTQAIRLKGDTTEFKADSFKVQANASVEDLLKKLPGIQVDKNGKITAQGEAVQKVLVDGEEFFGDDPTLVTKNLRADMVDKVQVYDKKSDQAAFTGIDDGQKTKTINVKLKEDKKNGYFGKLSAGAGTDGYHDSQLLFNRFRKKMKIAAYGILSNTGTAGLGWQDQNNYGGGNGMMTADANGNIIGQDDLSGWDGNYSGQGYPLVQTGGLHYNNKWDGDKKSINLNYKILQLFVNGNSTTNSEFILPDASASYYQNQHQGFKNQILRNKMDGVFETQFDSATSLKVTLGGTLIHKITQGTSATQSLLVMDSTQINNALGHTSTDGDNNSFNGEFLFKKKLKKKGRTLSVDFSPNYNTSRSTGYLFSQNNYFTHGAPSLSQVTDQYKTSTGSIFSLNTKATYTEPISVSSSLIASYGIQVNNSAADKTSFNKSQQGKYDSVDNKYSSDYSLNTFTQKPGLYYSLVKKKFRVYAGSDVGFSGFKQRDLLADTLGKRHFTNYYPSAFLTYNIASQNSIWLNYNGSTTQPTLQQIQPVGNNDDPLNIAVGNAALKPSFQNNFRLNYYFFKALSNKNLWSGINYNFTDNAISTNSYVDSIGRKITQAVNVNGNYSISANINYGFKWKKPDINFNLSSNISKNRYLSYVNSLLNTTNSGDYTLGLFAGKFKEKKIDISFQASVTYTNSKSSIQSSGSVHYWSYNLNPNADFFLPLALQIHSDLNYTFRQRTSAFDNNANVALWNAWFGKKFLKGEKLLIKVSANDILNQNKGITRNVNSNFISQNTSNSIQRFYLLSLVWNFSKAGTDAPQNNGMMIIN